MSKAKKKPTLSTFQTVLTELAEAFTRDNRADGTAFTKLRDKCPPWLKGSSVMLTIHSAVDDRLPDDWIYSSAYSIAQAMTGYSADNAEDMRDNVHEIADGMVDVYTTDRTAWLASHLYNLQLCDDACAELGCEGSDITNRIGVGQYYALERIASAIVEACDEEATTRREAFAERIADIAGQIA